MMTVRQGKQLILVAGGLIVLAVVLNVFVSLTRRGGALDYLEIAPPALFTVLLASIWRRYSRLEAEHGPNYVPASSVKARPALVGAGILAAILGALAGYLIATRR